MSGLGPLDEARLARHQARERFLDTLEGEQRHDEIGLPHLLAASLFGLALGLSPRLRRELAAYAIRGFLGT